MKKVTETQLEEIERQIANNGISDFSTFRVTWKDVINHIKTKQDFKTLFVKAAKAETLPHNKILMQKFII